VASFARHRSLRRSGNCARKEAACYRSGGSPLSIFEIEKCWRSRWEHKGDERYCVRAGDVYPSIADIGANRSECCQAGRAETSTIASTRGDKALSAFRKEGARAQENALVLAKARSLRDARALITNCRLSGLESEHGSSVCNQESRGRHRQLERKHDYPGRDSPRRGRQVAGKCSSSGYPINPSR
jgi:hypothetical protein